jgi:hypothetical protein
MGVATMGRLAVSNFRAQASFVCNDSPVIAGGVLSADNWILPEAFTATLHAAGFPSRI